jgi:nucleoside-diphosphate-sugar epimerase
VPGVIMVTGAYGYLGSLLRRRLDVEGWTTVALVRQPRLGDRAFAYALGDAPPREAFEGVDALVHCAWDFSRHKEAEVERVNVAGSVSLLRAASKAGVGRSLFISSMSAYPGTQQLYGRAKLAVEQACIDIGGIAVRPGLVYGDAPAGMAGALMALTKLPLIPVIGGDARQFPVHQDDLADAIANVLAAPGWLPETFGIAQPEPVGFRELLASFAAQHGRHPRFVPIPAQLVLGALRAAERLHVHLPLRSDSVSGLIHPAPAVPSSEAFPRLLEQLRTLRREA